MTKAVSRCSSRPEVLERMSNFSFTLQLPNLLHQGGVRNHTELVVALECFETIRDNGTGLAVYNKFVNLTELASTVLPVDMSVAGYCVSVFYALEESHNLINQHCRRVNYKAKNDAHHFMSYHVSFEVSMLSCCSNISSIQTNSTIIICDICAARWS